MTERDHAREQIITGLIGKRIVLYRRSAMFKASIDMLAETLPLWIDGIAAAAEAHDDAMRVAIAAAEKAHLVTVHEWADSLHLFAERARARIAEETK